MTDPLPAIAEADAAGAVATLFADIRAVTGVGVVNLIWRHLATIPGGLEFAWGAIRPRYSDGALVDAADQIRARIAVPDLGRLVLPDPAAGLIIAAYNRTNARALLALCALIARLDGVAAVPQAAHQPRFEDDLPLPPLPALAALPAELASLVLRLNLMGAGRPDPILASMYRHLAYWPELLATLEPRLDALDRAGRLRPMIVAALDTGRAAGQAFAPSLADMPALAAAELPLVRAALVRFAEDALARMVVICGAIQVAVTPISEGLD